MVAVASAYTKYGDGGCSFKGASASPPEIRFQDGACYPGNDLKVIHHVESFNDAMRIFIEYHEADMFTWNGDPKILRLKKWQAYKNRKGWCEKNDPASGFRVGRGDAGYAAHIANFASFDIYSQANVFANGLKVVEGMKVEVEGAGNHLVNGKYTCSPRTNYGDGDLIFTKDVGPKSIAWYKATSKWPAGWYIQTIKGLGLYHVPSDKSGVLPTGGWTPYTGHKFGTMTFQHKPPAPSIHLSDREAKHADDPAGCQKICKDTDGCKFFSFCADSSDCGLFKSSCGIIVNDECELTTTLGRDKLTTYKMFDAFGAPALRAAGGAGIAGPGLIAGLALASVLGGIAIFRRMRRMHQNGQRVEQSDQDAVLLYAEAARQGCAAAQNSLGRNGAAADCVDEGEE